MFEELKRFVIDGDLISSVNFVIFLFKGKLDAVKMSQDGFSVLFLPPFDDVAEIIAHDSVFVCTC